MADNKIPQSVLIADTRQKLAELSDRELPPSVLELLFKEAWLSVNFRAEREVKQHARGEVHQDAAEKDKQEEAE